MNRRTVISAMVGVGIGCAGNLGSPLAWADPVDTAGPVRDDQSGAAPPATRPGGGRGKPAPAPGDESGDGRGHGRGPGPGQWPWRPCVNPVWPPVPIPSDGGGSGGIVIAAAPALLASTAPPNLAPEIGPSAERVLTGFGPAGDPASGPLSPPSAGPGLAGPAPRGTAPAPRRPAGPPNPPPPQARSPQPAATPGDPVRLGYPGYLSDADMAQLVALALPGLAGLFGMTALGGVLGYRQARAGYALRAAGTARFLR